MQRIIIALFIISLLSCRDSKERLKQKFLPPIKNDLLKDLTRVDSIKIDSIKEINDLAYSQKAITHLEAERFYFVNLKATDEIQLEELKEIVYDRKYAPSIKKEIRKSADTITEIDNKLARLKNDIKTGKISANDSKGYIVFFKLLAIGVHAKGDTTRIREEDEYYISPELDCMPEYQLGQRLN